MEYFDLVHAHEPKFGLFFCHFPSQTFFLALFLSFFSLLSLLLPSAFHILSGCARKLGVNQGHRLEMGPRSVTGLVGHFTTTFCTKTDNVTFKLLHQNAIKIPKTTDEQIDLSLLYHLLINNVQWHLN